MKKFFSFLLIISLIFSMSIPAFATEGDTTPSEPTEQGGEVTPQEPSETPTEPSAEPSAEPSEGEGEVTPEEPSETPTEPSGGSTVVSLDGATVNVSDESISAIADAVVASNPFLYDYQYYIEGNSWNFVIDTNTPDLLDDYHVFITHPYSYDMNIVLGDVEFLEYAYGGDTPRHTYKGDIYKDSFSYNSSLGAMFLSFESVGILSDNYGSGDLADLNYTSKNIVASDTGNVIFYAVEPEFFTVSFDTGFDDLIVDSIKSTEFVLPVISRDGYRFDGWFFDSSFTSPYTDGFEFTKDTKLYAKWTPYRTITFVTGIEDFEVDSIYILSGDAYTPPVFTYAGYEFVGVYTDENFEHQFVGGTVIDADTTLYLRFEEIVYDYGAIATEQLKRLEGLVYVQMAQSVIFAVVLIAVFIFRKRDGFGV